MLEAYFGGLPLDDYIFEFFINKVKSVPNSKT